MYVILLYDINSKRVQKIHNICRKYLVRIQLSVFEGELTENQLNLLKEELKNAIKKDKDSIIIYTFKFKNMMKKEVIGVEKKNYSQIII